MKLRVVLILLSLAANVALAIVWTRQKAALDRHLSGERLVAPTTSVAARKGIPLDASTWKTLQANDDAGFVALLRCEGFPPAVVYALMRDRVEPRFADRRRALRAAMPPYWRVSSFWDDSDPERRAARRQLEREVSDSMTAALGPNADMLTKYERAEQARMYGNVSTEKADQLKAIETDYRELFAQIYDQAKGVTLKEDREKMIFLERERRADIVKVLSPDELREYDFRRSPSAMSVQSRLASFKPSEDEYRAITQLQFAFDEKYGNRNLSPAEEQRRNTALPELDQQIKGVLGPERFADFEITTDGSYRNVQQLVFEMKLPPETTRQTIAVQREIRKRVETTKQDSTLTAEARAQQLSTLADEARLRLSTTLGPDAFARYQRNNGEWITQLQPKPASGGRQ